jgi:predicted O-methyltransferase YrrM
MLIYTYTFFNRIFYLFKTNASFKIIKRYIIDTIYKKKLLSNYLLEYDEFLKEIPNLNLNSDWYSGNYLYWLLTFKNFNYYNKEGLQILEIGSWEGLTSFFILHKLKNANLTCVDTWGGSDEQNASSIETMDVLVKTESNFDNNLNKFGDRLKKIKLDSFSYFNLYRQKNHYDLIFVDGSHHCDDVIIDGIKAFEQLKIGGLLIFDDYFWRFYKNDFDNPASAINNLLNSKSNSFKIICVYEQIIIQKLSDRYA